MSTHREELVLVDEQCLYDSNAVQAFILRRVLASCIEDVRTDDTREIRQVHLAAGDLVNVREGCHPFEEDEEDFHGVAVVLWQHAAEQMQCSTAFALVLYA